MPPADSQRIKIWQKNCRLRKKKFVQAAAMIRGKPKRNRADKLKTRCKKKETHECHCADCFSLCANKIAYPAGRTVQTPPARRNSKFQRPTRFNTPTVAAIFTAESSPAGGRRKNVCTSPRDAKYRGACRHLFDAALKQSRGSPAENPNGDTRQKISSNQTAAYSAFPFSRQTGRHERAIAISSLG